MKNAYAIVCITSFSYDEQNIFFTWYGLCKTFMLLFISVQPTLDDLLHVRIFIASSFVLSL